MARARAPRDPALPLLTPARTWAAAGLLLLLFALQAGLPLPQMACTSDEVSHLPAGVTYWTTRDFRLNPQHPPLAKLVAALAVLPSANPPDLADPGWTSSPPDEWGYGWRWLWERNDGRALLLRARLPMVAMGTLLGLVTFLWSRSLFGPAGGLLSLALYALCPNLVAHSRWVTMDVPLALWSTLTLLLLGAWAKRGGRPLAAACGAALGLALATKFSALLFLPALGILGLLPVLGRGPRRIAWREAVPSLAVGVAAALFVVWAAYLFGDAPAIYRDGFRQINADHVRSYQYYLAGRFSSEGWLHYFLAAFLLKTPIPTLAAIAAALALVRRRPAPTGWDEASWLLPAVTFFAFTSYWADPLGVRYLLPVFPLLFVGAGRLAGLLRDVRPARWAGGALLLWLAVGAARIYPDHLAYFNEAAGGPENGWKWLDDSNLDWGQDLGRLKEVLDREGIVEPVMLQHWYVCNRPEAYGIRYYTLTNAEMDAATPAPGVYAVSAHLLVRGQLRADKVGTHGDWLRRYRPFARAGYGIYLFRFPQGGASGPAGPAPGS